MDYLESEAARRLLDLAEICQLLADNEMQISAVGAVTLEDP
jgi:hypothetical protein